VERINLAPDGKNMCHILKALMNILVTQNVKNLLTK
jgi:hypothetical protein